MRPSRLRCAEARIAGGERPASHRLSTVSHLIQPLAFLPAASTLVNGSPCGSHRMAITCARFLRFLRSIFVPTATTVAFSCLLTFFFVLYQPTRGPGDLQRLGWQAWDVISSQEPLGVDTATNPSTHPSGGEVDHSVDWWNVTKPAGSSVDTASLPLDVWAPLLPHDTGLSEIAVVRCMFDMRLTDMCSPSSTKQDDAIKGKWVRVAPDLNRQSGMWHLHLYYRRTRRLDIPLITDLQLLPASSSPSSDPSAWTKSPLSIRDGVVRAEPLFLWYKTGKTLQEMTTEERQELITEVDVLFGDGEPWFGFEKLEPATTEAQQGRRENVWVTYRRGVKAPPRAPPLHFSHDGRLKIMQVADLHFAVSSGTCRDPEQPCLPLQNGGAYNMTMSLLGRVLDAEKPDLVVFTGDQLNGQGTTWDHKSVLAKFAHEVIARRIPWAAVFGNHDDEDAQTTGWRKDQVKLMQGLPYSLVEAGPVDVHGVGNYVLKAYSADASKTQLLTLYFLDSGSYSKGFIDWFGFFTPTEYDWIHQDQIDWFLQESASINAIERPFTPDGAKDFGDVWGRQSADQHTPATRKLAKPNALMFFHIPLPESYGTADADPKTGRLLDVGEHDLEEKGSAKHNDGFFEKGLLHAAESEHRGAGFIPEVKVVGNGHCHVTENCRRVKGVWLCFGGGGSYEGYGRVGFDRRFRIYDISDYGETIRTYKRLESDEVLDEMILAGRGAPLPYTG
ncbi:Metallo-dependent phosphatase [Artomyces pyxidatus]|uniref:Metallo-dependent phosphatase n=1 Tax=Artomyces pyxidatus TaxID=48021 RepID=A0ACB8SCZ6_9AGAM|nr:Metallo-dependent phosphatase [Artomyces pyxidatus]